MCMDVYTCTCFQNLPDSPARIDFSGQANFSGFYQKGYFFKYQVGCVLVCNFGNFLSEI